MKGSVLTLSFFGTNMETRVNCRTSRLNMICIVMVGMWLTCVPAEFCEDRGDKGCYRSANANDYRGCVNITKTGRTCQYWTAQFPHTHAITPSGRRDHNFCRNPDGEPWVWCYTTDPDKRWEHCAIAERNTSCFEVQEETLNEQDLWSCKNHCGDLSNPIFCKCDDDCQMFHDCCIDYSNFCRRQISTTTAFEPSMFECIAPVQDDNYVHLISKCSKLWESNRVQTLCEDARQPDRLRDIIYRWPVYDEAGNNYKNWFCAICNFMKPKQVAKWNKMIISPTSKWPPTSHSQIHPNYYLTVGKRIRQCIRPAPPEGGGSSVSIVWNFNILRRPSNRNNDCPTGMIFDSLLLICRNINCPPGFHHKSDTLKCIKNVNGSILLDMQCASIFTNLVFTFPEVDFVNVNHHVDCFLNLLHESHNKGLFDRINRNIKLSEYQLPHSGNRGYLTDIENTRPFYIALEIEDKDVYHISQALKAASVNNKGKCSIKNVELITSCDKTGTLDACTGKWYEANSKNVSSVEVTNLMEVFLINETILAQPELVLYYYTIDIATEKVTEMLLICGTETPGLIPECSHITLNQSEFERILDADNETVFVTYGGKMFSTNEFILLPDSRLQLCVDNVLNSKIAFFDFSGYLDVANTVSSCISMTALFATFITYCKFKALRNLFGKALMNLLVALFASQLLPLLSKLSVGQTFCISLSAASHYSWLSSFIWMTILAVDLADRFAFRPLRIEVSDSMKTSLYLLSGWGIPFMVILPCLVLHFCKYSTISFQYGGPGCWIADPMANIIAFGVPVACSLILNVIFFVITISAILQAKSKSLQLQNKKKDSITMADVLVNLKISAVLGVSWIWGFIAGFHRIEALWWIFVILNAYQSVFIFFAYGLAKRSRQLWKKDLDLE